MILLNNNLNSRKTISEFPGSSINFSPYENDNISVTGPVNIIGQIHKNVLDGIRSAIGNQYASTKVRYET